MWLPVVAGKTASNWQITTNRTPSDYVEALHICSRSLMLSGGVEDSEAVGFCRIPIHDLGWRPSPLPNADAGRARKLDLPAGAFDCNARPRSNAT
jgi:hypothetical protein